MLSSELTTRPAAFEPEMVIPLNILYRDYAATGFGNGGFSFDIQGLSNTMMDLEVYIRYTLTFRETNAVKPVTHSFEGNDQTLQTTKDAEFHLAAPQFKNRLAFSQGFAMAHGIDKASITINEETVVQSPGTYVGLAERFYARPDEVNSVCSMSGGGRFDSGTFTPRIGDDHPPASASNADTNSTVDTIHYQSAQVGFIKPLQDLTGLPLNTVNMYAQVPQIPDFINLGYQHRFHRFASNLRSNVSSAVPNALPVANQSRFTGTTETGVVTRHFITLTERLPVTPFIMWKSRDKTRRLLNVRRLRMSFSLFPDWADRVMQGQFPDTGANLYSVSLEVAPVLQVKWIVPPKPQKLPQRLTMPWLFYELYSTNAQTVTIPDFVQTDHVSRDYEFTIKLRRSTFPKRLFIVVRPPVTNTAQLEDSVEHHMELASVTIIMDTHAGRLGRLDTDEMFALYVKNTPVNLLRTFDFEEWRKRYCVLVLRGEDIGWDFESRSGRQICFEVVARSHWALPSVGRQSEERLDLDREYRLDVLVENDYHMIMDKRRSELVRR